jgi:hypothetical protein
MDTLRRVVNHEELDPLAVDVLVVVTKGLSGEEDSVVVFVHRHSDGEFFRKAH